MLIHFQAWPYEHNITLQWVAMRTDRPWHHHQVSHCVMQVSNLPHPHLILIGKKCHLTANYNGNTYHIIIRRHFFVSQTYYQECVSSYKPRLYFKHDKEYCIYLARHRCPSSKNGWWYNSLQFFCLRSNRMIDTVVALLPVSAIQWQQLPTMNFLSISAWMCSVACS